MTERFRETFKDLNMTSEEVSRFAEAMKKEEFRKLLAEYAEEISDPKNRQLYEEEISKLEEERGNEVVFVHPEPGYCIKTVQEGKVKCFVNVCKNAHIDKPTAEREVRKSGGNGGAPASGLVWQIPHTCSKPREDLDQSGKNECVVYDVVFHPDAYRMGETNQRFNQLLKDSAFDTIENNFRVKLDRVNAKVLKNLNFKGKPTASVIRKAATSKPPKTTSSDENDQIGSIIDQLKQDYFEKQDSKAAAGVAPKTTTQPVNNVNKREEEQVSSKYTVPVYKMVHRGQIDMQDYSANVDNCMVGTTRPKELFIQIELPLCKSSADLILDIFEKRLYLESNEPDYQLDLKLPYPVDEKEARAKFDKSKRSLNVTLPVVAFSARVEIVSDTTPSKEEEEESQQSVESSVNNRVEEEKQNQLSSTSTPPSTVKYSLPSKTYVSEYKTSYSIRMKVSSYDPESIRLSLVDVDDSLMTIRVYVESTSRSSGYTQYYEAFIRISDTDNNNKSKSSQLLAITQNIGLENVDQVKSLLRIVVVNEDFFEIKISKKLLVQALSKFWVSSSSSIDSTSSAAVAIQVNTETASQIDQAWTEESSTNNKKPPLTDLSNSKNLNEMSRKDYVLNFEQNVRKNNDDDDDDSDEEETKKKDELEGSEEQLQQQQRRRSKFDKIDQVEKQRFEKKRPTPPAALVLSPTDEEINNNNINENDEDDDDDDMNSDTEKDYLRSSQKENSGDNRSSRPMEIGSLLRSDENNNSMNSLSSSANEFGSSLGSSSNTFYRLKGILKKPRSVSESSASTSSSPGLPPDTPTGNPMPLSRGASLTSQVSQQSSLSSSSSSSQKKCVSFSNQVVRNTFKTGSTVAGMRKPGHASKKKNKRKRTVSDPSHDSGADAMDLKQSMSSSSNNNNESRARSMSESSSGDDHMFMSNESLEDEEESNEAANTKEEKQPETAAATNNNGLAVSNKKKKKKKSNQIAESKKENTSNNKNSSSSSSSSIVKSGFDVETMLEWKNQGKLSEEREQSSSSTKCGFKFKNKLIDQLD